MTKEEARQKMQAFLGDTVLTFHIRDFPSGEWVAECNEIPAIMTGGMGHDITQMDSMIRDAIVTAAGIDTKYAREILEFVGLQKKQRAVLSGLLHQSPNAREAEYAVTV